MTDTTEATTETAVEPTTPTVTEAVRRYQETAASIRTASSQRLAEADRVYRDLSRENEVVTQKAKDAALEELTKVGGPLVTYVMKQNYLREWPDHTTTFLTWLPASYNELVAKGRAVGWCGDYNRMLDRAVAAGVIVDDRTATERVDSVVSAWGLNRANRERLEALIKAAVDEAVAQAKVETTDAA